MTTTHNRRMYIFLMVLAIAISFSFQGWRTLLNNFAVEEAAFQGIDMGILQSVREIPGFLALLAMYVILIISEHKLAALSVLLMGLGATLGGLFPTTFGLVLTTLLMSFGFHYYETMNQSLTLQHFDRTTSPLVMGRMRSLSALASLLAYGAIFLLTDVLDYAGLFMVAGSVALAAGLWGMFQKPVEKEAEPQRKAIFVKSGYWLYYALTMLAGARRQVFVAFSVFLLVSKFELTLTHITALFLVNSVVNYFANPWIGRAVNKYGERKVLTLEYAALALIFVGYGVTESPWIAAFLYVLDNLFFNFAMAIKTFYQKIAAPEDIASGMAVGFTINHIAAVFIPLAGGLVWMRSSSLVFIAGAVLSLISLLLVQFIDRELLKKDSES